jgi:hypothetical protein
VRPSAFGGAASLPQELLQAPRKGALGRSAERGPF